MRPLVLLCHVVPGLCCATYMTRVSSASNRLLLERTGATVDVDRNAAVLLTETELSDKPFRYDEVEKARQVLADEAKDTLQGRRGRNEIRSRDNDRSSERNSEMSGRGREDRDHGGGSGSSKRKGDLDDSRDGPDDVRDKKRSRGSKDDSHYEAAPLVVSAWLRTGIRVRIVSKKASASSKHYLQKAHVMDVYQGSSLRMATLRMEGDGSVIENVKEKYLETVLPGVGEVCMILSGAEKGQLANLLEKRKDKDSAVVQLVDDMSEILTIPMDEVAAIAT